MIRSYLVPVVIITHSICNMAAFAGGGVDTGNGIDDTPAVTTPESAWFRRAYQGEEKVIRYCVQVSDDFGIPLEELNQDIQNAFKTWENYVIADNIRDYLGKAQHSFVLTATKIPSCSGQEDLKFNFGLKDTTYWINFFQFKNPIAFAKKLSSETQTWGKGMIWFSGPGDLTASGKERSWTSVLGREALRGAILHELGHVYGNSHLDQTIMQADARLWWDTVPSQLPSVLRMQQFRMHNIDHENQLITHQSYKGFLPVHRYIDEEEKADLTKLFQYFGIPEFDAELPYLYQVELKTSQGTGVSEFILRHPRKTVTLNVRHLMYVEYQYLMKPMFCSAEWSCDYGRKFSEAVMIRLPNGVEYPGVFSTNGASSRGGNIELGPRLTLLNFSRIGITLFSSQDILQGWVDRP